VTAPLLEIERVAIRRGRTTVVSDLTVSLGAGLTAICGPNGSGKSSLLAALAGLLPYGGAVRLEGRPFHPADLAYMPQAAALAADLTAFEVVLLGRLDRLRWRVGEDDLAAAVAALDDLGIADLAERPVRALSGGQQQLVLLAQKLVKRPRVLLLDEPTSALDLQRQLAVLEWLSAYAASAGALVVAVLHDLSLAARYATRLLLLRDGRLHADGAPEAILDPATIDAVYGVEAEILRIRTGQPVVAPLRASAAGRPT